MPASLYVATTSSFANLGRLGQSLKHREQLVVKETRRTPTIFEPPRADLLKLGERLRHEPDFVASHRRAEMPRRRNTSAAGTL